MYMGITSEAWIRETNFPFLYFSSFGMKKRVAYLELVDLNMLNLVRVGFKCMGITKRVCKRQERA